MLIVAMGKVEKSIKKFFNKTVLNKPVIFVVAFAVVGVVILVATYAATPSADLEAENGSKTLKAVSIADSSASGGRAIQFGYTLDSSFDYPSKSNAEDYRQSVDFNVVCIAGQSAQIVRIAADDPIVYPGQPGAAHMHVFVGNSTVNAFSTQDSLEAGGTQCRLPQDTATYWMPALYTPNGTATLTDDPMINPYHMRAYYRAGSLNPVSHYPRGLKMIAGDMHATSPQDKRVAGWQCRTISPDTQSVPKQSTIPTCPAGDVLEASVVFPNCWDGVNLDSADHKSHMSYSWDSGSIDDCDSAHPVLLPQVTIAYRYPADTTNSSSYLSAHNSGLTLHADFWNAWHQPTLDALVDRCINAGVHCGDVSPTHFPGPIPQ